MAKITPSPSSVACPPGMTPSQWQIQLRVQAAKKASLTVSDLPDKNIPGLFSVVNPKTRRNYKVVFHGLASSWNSCDCMDFRTNGLGTCKHIEAVGQWLKSKGQTPDMRLPRNSGIDVCYIGGRRLRFRLGVTNKESLSILALRYFDDDFFAVPGMITELPSFIEQARTLDRRFYVSADALNLILEERDNRRRQELIKMLGDAEIASVINTELYPYQLEGIRFAFGAGRALIADEMGLGKTVQAITTAELLKSRSMASSALILCPTSLKYQWKSEIERFTNSDVTIVEGIHSIRRDLYSADTFYKIVSYHTLANDIKAIGSLRFDILIMDEVQRLNNWNPQIYQAARQIENDYAVVLSGTPLENKPEELFRVIQFVDQYALGPYHEHAAGQNISDIVARLKGCMIRRRIADVSLQLPARSERMLLVPMTKEQQAIHDNCKAVVVQLALKWVNHSFLSEKDRKRLMVALGQMRMVCDSTYIIDRQTRCDTKIAEAVQLVKDSVENGHEKIVIFSQWERMARLVAEELDRENIGYEYLHGGVMSSKRASMTARFADDREVNVFLSTDALCSGLNLHCASLIINLDMPWNPAMHEKRIDRVYRKGMEHLQVINLVSSGSIEERMLASPKYKAGYFADVFDSGDDRITIDDAKLTQVSEAVIEMCDDRENQSEPSVVINAFADLLSKPECIDALVDNFVKTDSEGRTAIQIPVENKEAAIAFFTVLGGAALGRR